MEHFKILNDIPIELKKGIIKSIQDAIGDDIILDRKNNELDTHNGDPNRIWDFINRNLEKNLESEDYIVRTTKRGRWEMKFIVDKRSGILYTLMREERFNSLKKEVPKRKTIHYIQAIADTFNTGLKAREQQLSLFKEQNYYSEDAIKKIVDKVLTDLLTPKNIISNHVIVLFQGKSHELESVRCCIINGDLGIVEEESWNEYIEMHESVVMHEVKEANEQANNPTLGLRYKQKAKDKIGQTNNSEYKKEKKKKYVDMNNTKDETD